MHFTWIIKRKLAASSIPTSIEDIEFVRKENINAIVCLVEENELEIMDDNYNVGIEAYKRLLSKRNIELLHAPIKDFSVPTLEQLEYVINWIETKIKENKSVMVHCRGGLGRTGTVVDAFLMYENGYTAEEAIKYIRSLRPGSIENYNQIKFLKYYENYLRNKIIYK